MDTNNTLSPFPLVSIITPSFNQGQFIEETILSVLNQGYPHIEYIVIDGGSTDGTLDILQKYKDRLTCISGPDGGQSDAINKGWRKAQGEIMAWLNSDDRYCPGAIRKVVEVFKAQPEVDVVYGDNYVIDAHGEIIYRMKACPATIEDLLCFRIIHQPAVFLRKRVINKIGYLNTDLHYLMDHEYWIRAAIQCRFQHIGEFLSRATEHPESKSVIYQAEFAHDALAILDAFYSDGHRAEVYRSIRQKAYGGAHLMSAFWCRLARENEKARNHLIKAVKCDPKLFLHELTIPLLIECFTGLRVVQSLRRVKHKWIRLRMKWAKG